MSSQRAAQRLAHGAARVERGVRVLEDQLEAAAIPYVIASGCSADALPERFRNKPRLEKPYRLEALTELIAAV